jgi:hypothetical protein
MWSYCVSLPVSPVARDDSVKSPDVNVPRAIRRLKFLGSRVENLILPVVIEPVVAKTVVD